jgi:hypothetical protein
MLDVGHRVILVQYDYFLDCRRRCPNRPSPQGRLTQTATGESVRGKNESPHE